MADIYKYCIRDYNCTMTPADYKKLYINQRMCLDLEQRTGDK